MAGSSLPEESPSSYVEGIERRLEAARLAETTDDHLADDGIRRRRFTEYASFLPEESLPLTEATLFREPTISTAARARATKTQARFARRLAQKMENRRQDKSTIRRDHALLWTSVAGIAVMMLDFELLLHAPGAYVWGGFVVRCANSLLTLALVAHLHSYYAYLLARKRTNFAPYIRHFLQEPSLRWRFLAELVVCLPHAPPTCLPPLAVPPPHACGLDGYRGGADGLATAALHDHPACHLVWEQQAGALALLRTYHVCRVLRDQALIWRNRSIVKSAATQDERFACAAQFRAILGAILGAIPRNSAQFPKAIRRRVTSLAGTRRTSGCPKPSIRTGTARRSGRWGRWWWWRRS